MKKHETVHSTTMSITPKIAAEWLTLRPPHQRALSDLHVERLAREMAEGRWALNGDAIVFDTSGALFDGQHRLHAVVRSGATISSVVTRGVDPESFATKDRGRVRTPGDIFSIAGYSNSHATAAIARHMMTCDSAHRSGTLRSSIATPETVLEYAGQHQAELAWAVSYRVEAKSILGRIAAVSGVLGYLRTYLRESSEHFASRLLAGTMLEERDPILILRNRLLTRDRAKGDELRTIAEVVSMFSAHQRGSTLRGMIPIHTNDNGAISMPLIYVDENRVILHDRSVVWHSTAHHRRHLGKK